MFYPIWVACVLCCYGLTMTKASVNVQIGLAEAPRGPLGNETETANTSIAELQSVDGTTVTDGGTNAVTYGSSVKHGHYPYVCIVLIYYYGYYYRVCGCVIVNSHTVITAAHCLRFIKNYNYYVGVGITNLRYGLYTRGSQLLKVTNHKIHSGWDPYAPGYPNNIAALYLHCRIKYNQWVQPAKLATRHDGYFDNYGCVIVGWGYTHHYGYPSILQHAALNTISNYFCRLFWAVVYRARILNTHICAYRYPVSACFGDGGGPLVCRGKVVGLVSWGRKDCSGCQPNVFTRITSYLGWIKEACKLI